MLTTFCILPPVQSPADAKTQLETTLSGEGVIGFDVALLRVDGSGFAFSISADETEQNQIVLTTLCGTLNLRLPQTQQALMADSGTFRVFGSEGRFAREHRLGEKQP